MQEAAFVRPKACARCGARYPGDALFCPLDGMPLQSVASAAQHDVRDSEDDPYLGQEISGHIEIRQLVGIGAMGRVYRAFQRGIDRDVAVKILHRELSANAQLVSRFTREAKVASRLQHPNVVQVLLAGQLPDRALYMVMEYLEGLSLQSALAAAGGALPLPRALHIAMQLCEASGEAHAVGIVHRDIKPENVMLVRRGTDPDFVKVLDFGIARMDWGEQSVATAAGLIFGTARYISPEGAQGNAVGPASDVYAIATLLYQMLAGRTPFEGDQAVGLLVQQIHDAPPHLTSIPRAGYVPGPLADVIMANLAKDPKQREQDARAFGHAIVDAAKQSGLSPDDISRPMLRRQSSAMQLAPTERTKSFQSAVDLPEPSPHKAGDSKLTAATVKWEPPSEFQARLNEAVLAHERVSGAFPALPTSDPHVAAPVAAGSRSRIPSVDETLDDADMEPPYASPSLPLPTLTSAAAIPPSPMPGDAAVRPRRTDYAAPAEAEEPVARRHKKVEAEPRKGRGVLFVACFVLGMAIATGWAWKVGKLGGSSGDDEHYVARATEAMYKNRFVAPPGENVRDITDDGLKKWPNDPRLLDVRVRSANELVSQAVVQRTAGDIVEALRLARAASELDPADTSVKRLVEQYEAELAAFTTPPAPPLAKASSAPATLPTVKPSAVAAAAAPSATPHKIMLEANVVRPKLGQTVEFTARVAPTKGSFQHAMFNITGPGLGGGVNMEAQTSAPGVFKVSYAFLVGGRFDVTFTLQADGKGLRAGRSLVAGEQPSAPKAPDPASASSVKWM